MDSKTIKCPLSSSDIIKGMADYLKVKPSIVLSSLLLQSAADFIEEQDKPKKPA